MIKMTTTQTSDFANDDLLVDCQYIVMINYFQSILGFINKITPSLFINIFISIS